MLGMRGKVWGGSEGEEARGVACKGGGDFGGEDGAEDDISFRIDQIQGWYPADAIGGADGGVGFAGGFEELDAGEFLLGGKSDERVEFPVEGDRYKTYI